MYTTIYRPKSTKEFIGNNGVIQPFIKWLLEWDSNDKKNKCALVSGLCGIGKNLLVELILRKHDYNIIELATDDERDKTYINTTIKPLIKSKQTFDGQENALVVSDVDSTSDYGFIATLTELIKETEIPIICICNNRYEQSIKPILNYCFDIKMTKPSYQDVYRLVYKVVITEKIKIKESEIKDLYEQSGGDIRFILNTLQLGSRKGKKNIQSTNIFETTGKMLSMDEPINSKYEAYWLSNDLMTLMVQENYINNTLASNDQAKRLENISYSADALCDGDLLETYVNMTNWEIEPYVAFSCINAASKCNKKAMIKFPQFLGRTSTINKNKKLKKGYDGFDELLRSIEVKKSEKQKTTQTAVEGKKPRGRPKKTK